MLQSTKRRKLKWLAVLQLVVNQGQKEVIPTEDVVWDFDVVEGDLMQLLHSRQDNQ